MPDEVIMKDITQRISITRLPVWTSLVILLVFLFACNNKPTEKPISTSSKTDDLGIYNVCMRGEYLYIAPADLSNELIQHNLATGETKHIDLSKVIGKKGYFIFECSPLSESQ